MPTSKMISCGNAWKVSLSVLRIRFAVHAAPVKKGSSLFSDRFSNIIPYILRLKLLAILVK